MRPASPYSIFVLLSGRAIEKTRPFYRKASSDRPEPVSPGFHRLFGEVHCCSAGAASSYSVVLYALRRYPAPLVTAGTIAQHERKQLFIAIGEGAYVAKPILGALSPVGVFGLEQSAKNSVEV
jgi:hypothetical protein